MRRLTVILLFVCLRLASATDPLTVWHARNPSFPGLTLNAVVSTNGTTVAVGSDGRAIVSSDLIHWVEVPTPTFSDLNSITFGEGRFAAAGDFGTIIISTNGFDWWEATTDTLNNLNGISCANGAWVAVGKNAEILLSTNGSTFATVITGSTTLTSVNYALGQFIAVGEEGALLTSATGQNWSRRFIPTGGRIWGTVAAEGKVVVYGQGSAFVVSAGVWTTTNLTDWRGTPDYSSANVGAYNNGRFELMGGGAVTSSTNGFDWFSSYAGPGFIELYGMVSDKGLLIGVASDGAVLLSATGEYWTNQTVLHQHGLGHLVHGANGYMAAGDNEVLFSADGLSWQTVFQTNNLLYALEYGQGVWVISGPNFVASTTDLQIWHQTENITLTSIAYGAGRFVAIDINHILDTSTDGENWSGMNVAFAESLRKVTYVGGTFVGIGNNGVILTSVNGLDWTRSNLAGDFAGSITDVAFGNGIFLAALDYGTQGFMISSNAVDWALTSAAPTSVSRIIFGGGTFLGLGSDVLRASVDGQQWRIVASNLGYISDATFADDRFTTVGVGPYSSIPRIYQSDPFSSQPPLIFKQPLNTVVDAGASAIFSVAANGSSPFQYQWFLGGQPIFGATESTLLLANVQPTNAGFYTVVVSNSFGHVESFPALLTIAGDLTPHVDLAAFAGLTITGRPGRTYEIQYSDQLSSPSIWHSATNLTLSATPFLWIDLGSSNRPRRFYRAMLLP